MPKSQHATTILGQVGLAENGHNQEGFAIGALRSATMAVLHRTKASFYLMICIQKLVQMIQSFATF